MPNIKNYERKQKIKEKLYKFQMKICYIIFYPLRILYKYYEPSKLRKWAKTKKYYREMKNSLYEDLLSYDSLILTDCRLETHHNDYCDIISTEHFNTYYSYRYWAKRNYKELLEDILFIFKKDSNIEIKEVKPEEVFKYMYEQYKDGVFYRVKIKKGK